MDYEQFLEQVRDVLREQFPEMDVEIRNVDKLQGESYTGIFIAPEGSRAGANLNLHGVFEQVQDGMPMDEALAQIKIGVLEAASHIPEMAALSLTDYELMKHNIIMQAVPTDANRAMLATVPHKEIEDFSIVYRFQLENMDGREATVLITNEMLAGYGITPRQLMTDAERLAPVKNPMVIRPIGDMIAEMLGIPNAVDPAPSEDRFLLVATVPDGRNGAGILGYPDFFKRATEAVRGDFFLLPSSVHEVLLLPDDGAPNVAVLNDMISSINNTEVRPEDRLGDEAYHYDAKTQIFEKATAHERRMMESRERVLEPESSEIHEPAASYVTGPAPDRMNVLMVEPDQYPRPMEMGTSLEDLQAAVGGYIEVIYPFDEPVGLMMNEEGKLIGLPLNRGLRDEKGDLYDVVAGPFVVVGLTDDGFKSLTQEQMDRYADLFHQPEMFVKMGKGINVIPLPDEMVQGLQEASKSAAAKPGKVHETKEAHRKRQDRDER